MDFKKKKRYLDMVLTKAILLVWKVPAVVVVIAAQIGVKTGAVGALEPLGLVARPWPKGQKTDSWKKIHLAREKRFQFLKEK